MLIVLIGIIDLWYDHVEFAIKTNKRYHRTQLSSDEAKAFKLADMQTAFYILFIGLFVSTLVFIGELIIYKHKKHTPFKFVH